MKTKTIWLKVACTILFFTVLSKTTQAQKDSTIRVFYNPKWEQVLTRKPYDDRKWQDYELYSKMYAKYSDPDVKELSLVFNILDVDGKNKIKNIDIQEQIEILNQAFRGEFIQEIPSYFKGIIAVDTKISFCLGKPEGLADGVKLNNKGKKVDLSKLELIIDSREGISPTNQANYINIWISELDDNMAGFAFLPGHDSILDGIVIDADFFGSKKGNSLYDEGKTLVHLMGQYLGLKPLWTDLKCTDDGVEDTPIHNAPNYSCYADGHISLCSGYPMEMVGNFMDGNIDRCASYFTVGQVARMHANLGNNGYRSDLLKGASNCKGSFNNSDLSLETRNLTSSLDFSIIPNPAQEYVEFHFQNPRINQNINVKVHDISGKLIYEHVIPALSETNGKLHVDLKVWPYGQYFVTLNNGSEIKTKTLVTIK